MAQPPYDPYGGYGPSDPYAQQQPYGQPYGQPPAVEQHHYYGGPPAPIRNNGMAIASMVLGIIGLITCGLVVFSLGAIILGHVAQSQIKRTREQGGGMAIAGLVLGYIFAILGILYWVVIVGIYGAAWYSLSNDGSSI